MTSFNQISNTLPLMCGKILSDRLKILQEKWLIKKTVTSTTPIHVAYYLTPLWESVAEHIAAMGKLVGKLPWQQ